jgi:hypothetical protein
VAQLFSLGDFAIMNAVTDSTLRQDERRWRQFFWLLLIFLSAAMVSSLLPTPNSWSDIRSQWLPSAAMALTAFCLFVATFWIYQRPGYVFKIQAVVLWFLFGAVLAAATYSLFESFTFLREVRGSHV